MYTPRTCPFALRCWTYCVKLLINTIIFINVFKLCTDAPFIQTLGQGNWESVMPEAQVHGNQVKWHPCALCPFLTSFCKCLYPQGRRGAMVMHNLLTGMSLGTGEFTSGSRMQTPLLLSHLRISGTLPSSPLGLYSSKGALPACYNYRFREEPGGSPALSKALEV